jgi:hypothetical protein
MKVDVEGFEIEVRNSTSTEAVGTDRGPVVDLLARHGYRLHRPAADGSLSPLTDPSFGPDVFACQSS